MTPLLTPAAAALLDNDVRPSTKAQYESRIKIFSAYCERVGEDPATCHPNVVMNFLTELWRDKGLGYQSICGYRSAIARQHAGIGNLSLSEFPGVRRLVRACFVERPPLPKYGDIWDVDKVLSWLETLHPAAALSRMDLAIKTATLTFILTLSRFCHFTLAPTKPLSPGRRQ